MKSSSAAAPFALLRKKKSGGGGIVNDEIRIGKIYYFLLFSSKQLFVCARCWM